MVTVANKYKLIKIYSDLLNTKAIIIKLDTDEELSKIKHTGQTYDGVIKDLLSLRVKNRNDTNV